MRCKVDLNANSHRSHVVTLFNPGSCLLNFHICFHLASTCVLPEIHPNHYKCKWSTWAISVWNSRCLLFFSNVKNINKLWLVHRENNKSKLPVCKWYTWKQYNWLVWANQNRTTCLMQVCFFLLALLQMSRSRRWSRLVLARQKGERKKQTEYKEDCSISLCCGRRDTQKSQLVEQNCTNFTFSHQQGLAHFGMELRLGNCTCSLGEKICHINIKSATESENECFLSPWTLFTFSLRRWEWAAW